MAADWRKLLVLIVAGLSIAAATAPAVGQTSDNGGNGGQSGSGGTGDGNGRSGTAGIYHYWIPGKTYPGCQGCSATVETAIPDRAVIVPKPTSRSSSRHAHANPPPTTAAVPTIASIATPTPRPLPPVSGPAPVTGSFVPDEVLVTVRGGPQAVSGLAASFRLQVRSQRQSALLGATIARLGIPDGRPVGLVLAQLAGDSRVDQSAPNHLYALQQSAVPGSVTVERIALDVNHANGSNVRIGVIDTAADLKHAALRGVVAKTFNAWPEVPTKETDHATSIVGLMAGHGAFHGVAPGARVYLARAFEKGQSRMDVLLKAMDWVASQNVRIINMSFAGPKNRLFAIACRAARKRGILLVAAAGNEGPTAPFAYPAAFDDVMAVTAIDARNGIMPQANRGSYVFISAPGVDLMAPVPNGMDFVTGTSFAAAVVSGAAADLIHNSPGRSVASLERALARTAVDLGPHGRDKDFGYGLIDVAAAAKAED